VCYRWFTNELSGELSTARQFFMDCQFFSLASQSSWSSAWIGAMFSNGEHASTVFPSFKEWRTERFCWTTAFETDLTKGGLPHGGAAMVLVLVSETEPRKRECDGTENGHRKECRSSELGVERPR
jgi:hypothetical protein